MSRASLLPALAVLAALSLASGCGGDDTTKDTNTKAVTDFKSESVPASPSPTTGEPTSCRSTVSVSGGVSASFTDDNAYTVPPSGSRKPARTYLTSNQDLTIVGTAAHDEFPAALVVIGNKNSWQVAKGSFTLAEDGSGMRAEGRAVGKDNTLADDAGVPPLQVKIDLTCKS